MTAQLPDTSNDSKKTTETRDRVILGVMLIAIGLLVFLSQVLDLPRIELLILPGLALISDPRARYLAFKGDAAPALYAMLDGKGVVTDLRDDVLRIGCALYQDEGDVDALLAILKG